MRICQIDDMDVVADGGPVGRVVVGAEDLHGRPRAHRRADDQRNDVRLGIVILPDFALGIRAGGVEVAQRHPPQAVALAIPAQDLFDHQFRFAVGIHRRLWVRLVDRDANRIAIRGTRGREDNPPDSRLAHRVEQVQRADGVGAKVLRRVAHRLADEGIRREMNHGVDWMARKHLAQANGIPQAAALDRSPFHRPVVALTQVVEHDWRMSGCGEELRRVTADVAGAAGHEYAHGFDYGVSCRTPTAAAPGEEPSKTWTSRPVSAEYTRAISLTRSPERRSPRIATVPPLPPPVILAPYRPAAGPI